MNLQLFNFTRIDLALSAKKNPTSLGIIYWMMLSVKLGSSCIERSTLKYIQKKIFQKYSNNLCNIIYISTVYLFLMKMRQKHNQSTLFINNIFGIQNTETLRISPQFLTAGIIQGCATHKTLNLQDWVSHIHHVKLILHERSQFLNIHCCEKIPKIQQIFISLNVFQFYYISVQGKVQKSIT